MAASDHDEARFEAPPDPDDPVSHTPARKHHAAARRRHAPAPAPARKRSRVRAGVFPNQSLHARLNELCSR